MEQCVGRWKSDETLPGNASRAGGSGLAHAHAHLRWRSHHLAAGTGPVPSLQKPSLRATGDRGPIWHDPGCLCFLFFNIPSTTRTWANQYQVPAINHQHHKPLHAIQAAEPTHLAERKWKNPSEACDLRLLETAWETAYNFQPVQLLNPLDVFGIRTLIVRLPFQLVLVAFVDQYWLHGFIFFINDLYWLCLHLMCVFFTEWLDTNPVHHSQIQMPSCWALAPRDFGQAGARGRMEGSTKDYKRKRW